jgi:FkbM family methyltransferase
MHMHSEWLGNTTYGGWETVTEGLGTDSVVYSFGVGTDMSWDLELIRRFGCRVYAFDPNPVAVAFVGAQTLPSELRFTPTGIAAYDGTQSFWGREGKVSTSTVKKIGGREDLPVRTLETLMRERGHERVDVLKLDIEGSEFSVVPRIVSLPIRQILLEMHTRFYRHGWKGLRRMWGWYLARRLFRALKRSGFVLVNEAGDDYTFYRPL